jgi:hypothetical protein
VTIRAFPRLEGVPVTLRLPSRHHACSSKTSKVCVPQSVHYMAAPGLRPAVSNRLPGGVLAHMSFGPYRPVAILESSPEHIGNAGS